MKYSKLKKKYLYQSCTWKPNRRKSPKSRQKAETYLFSYSDFPKNNIVNIYSVCRGRGPGVCFVLAASDSVSSYVLCLVDSEGRVLLVIPIPSDTYKLSASLFCRIPWVQRGKIWWRPPNLEFFSLNNVWVCFFSTVLICFWLKLFSWW